jgi:hypothetical protein
MSLPSVLEFHKVTWLAGLFSHNLAMVGATARMIQHRSLPEGSIASSQSLVVQPRKGVHKSIGLKTNLFA